MAGEQSGLMGVFGKVVPMDRLVGPDFEKGLARLKTVAEGVPTWQGARRRSRCRRR